MSFIIIDLIRGLFYLFALRSSDIYGELAYLYHQTHFRAFPWIVGMMLGVFAARNKQINIPEVSSFSQKVFRTIKNSFYAAENFNRHVDIDSFDHGSSIFPACLKFYFNQPTNYGEFLQALVVCNSLDHFCMPLRQELKTEPIPFALDLDASGKDWAEPLPGSRVCYCQFSYFTKASNRF